MRISILILLIVGGAACGHDSSAQPDAALDGAPDAPADTTIPGVANVIVAVATTGRQLPAGFSGFNYDGQETAVRYSDPQARGLLDALDAGFVRFPGGSTGNAHNWETGGMAATLEPFPYVAPSAWVTEVEQDAAQSEVNIEGPEIHNMGKGFSTFDEFRQLAGTRPVIITANAFTDSVAHVGELAAAACGPHGVHVVFFELANEAYLYSPARWRTGAAYAHEMAGYRDAIAAHCPGVPISMFFTDRDSRWNSGTTANPATGLFAASQGFDDIATHVYPMADSTTCGSGTAMCSVDQAVAVYNGVLATGTNTFVDSYFVAQKPNANIEITELNLGAGDGRTLLQTSIYQAIFLTEYVARLSSDAHVAYVGVHQVYQPVSTGQANGTMMLAHDDHTTEITAAARTGTGPIDTTGFDFGFSISVPGQGLLLLNAAVNSNTTALATTLAAGPAGSATVPASATDANATTPAVFAQAYGSPPSLARSIVLTNKGGTAQVVEIDDGGVAVTAPMTISQLAGMRANDLAPVATAAMPSSNPVTVPPFSVVRVDYP